MFLACLGLFWMTGGLPGAVAADRPGPSPDATSAVKALFNAGKAVSFDDANQMYEQGRFNDAAAGYQQLVKDGRVSTAVYFNLGNALFKSGQIGLAIVNYRNAAMLSPRDPDVRANLQFARNSVNGAGSAKAPWWRRALERLTLNEWTGLAAAAAWTWFTLLTLVQWKPSLGEAVRSYRTVAGMLTLILVCCLGLVLRDRYGVASGVVIVREAVVRYGPLEKSTSFYTVRDGSELVIKDKYDHWLQVIDATNRKGWLQAQHIVIVNNDGSVADSRP